MNVLVLTMSKEVHLHLFIFFILLQILHLFEEPEHWLEMHKKREELPGALGKGEMDDSDPHDFWVIYDK